MEKKDRFREVLDGPLTDETLERRAAEGWRAVAVEWERPATGEPRAVLARREIPYGLKMSDDGRHLEECVEEVEAMVFMLEMMVQDAPLSQIADELNARAFRTRIGGEWTQTTIFNLLPRLVAAGPDIFASEQWAELRAQRRRAPLRAV